MVSIDITKYKPTLFNVKKWYSWTSFWVASLILAIYYILMLAVICMLPGSCKEKKNHFWTVRNISQHLWKSKWYQKILENIGQHCSVSKNDIHEHRFEIFQCNFGQEYVTILAIICVLPGTCKKEKKRRKKSFLNI